MRNELWQKQAIHWQNQLIHHNILLLGHTAWNNYLHHGRGITVCTVVDAVLPSTDWSSDIIAFEQAFVPQAQAALYLQSLQLESDAVSILLKTIASYDPTQSMIVLVMRQGEVNLNLIQNLAVSPPDCYEQVQRRWAEFQPASLLKEADYECNH